MTPLAAALKKSSLQKKDLGLELEELETAARMVVDEDEEESTSASSDDSSSSSSSSSSSDESEESEAGGEGGTLSGERGGGGGGEEMCKDNPLQPQPCTAASPIPQELTCTLSDVQSAAREVDSLPSAPDGSRQLIQELGKRVAEELRISQSSSSQAERRASQPGSSAHAETQVTSEKRSSGTLLELSPRKNPLLIVQPQDEL